MFDDILKEVIQALNDWPLGTIAAVLTILAVMLLVGLVLWGLFIAVDSWFLPRHRGKGRVTHKEFTPAHTQIIYIYNVATKTNMPHVIQHPDNWSLTVDVSGLSDSISVGNNFYNRTEVDDWITVEYVQGRFSGGLYLKEVFA